VTSLYGVSHPVAHSATLSTAQSLASRTQESTAEIHAMIEQIASAAEEQNAVAEEINGSVLAISEITEQTASASNELNQLSEQLSAMVRQFKV